MHNGEAAWRRAGAVGGGDAWPSSTSCALDARLAVARDPRSRADTLRLAQPPARVMDAASKSSRRRPNTTRRPRWCRRPSLAVVQQENATGNLSATVRRSGIGRAAIAALVLLAVSAGLPAEVAPAP